jgi:hypothetical protein
VSEATRTVAFGDVESGVWGVVWGELVAIGDAPLGTSTIEGWEADEDWRITADYVELTVAPEGAPSSQDGFEQLCRVRGHVQAEAIDCLGRRASRSVPLDSARFESVREVSAWFEPDEGLAVVALRPRRAGNHAADLVTATLLEPTGPVAVEEPRLSTTYTSDGRPSRMSLELWLGGEHEQYPRRAAGEAFGPDVSGVLLDFEVRVQPLRCHSRGREGTGVYLIARAR